MRNTTLFLLSALLLASPGRAADLAPCDRASVQARLNAGESAFTLYKACGRSLPLLYGLDYKNGVLAWLDTSNGSGLVATPSALPIGAFWDNMSQAGWTTTSGTSPAMGTGKANTAKIVAAGGVPQPLQVNYFNYAAYASTLTINGRNDWYLPSQDEMAQVFRNVPITISACVNNIGDPGYWTSTQVNYQKAVYIDCSGNPKTERTNSTYGVRMVRAFVDGSPVVGLLSPSTVRAGTVLTISGGNFNAAAALNSVTFTGGLTVVASTASPTSLTVTVPAGVQSGPIIVTSDGSKSAPSASSLTVEIVPTVTAFTPRMVQAGDTLTVAGTDFSPSPASNTVVFKGFPAIPFMAGAGLLKVVVPSQAVTGPIAVGTLGVLSEPSRDTLVVTQPLTFIQAPQRLMSYTVGGYMLAGVFLNKPCTQNCIYVGGSPGQAGRGAYPSNTGTSFKFMRADGGSFRLTSMVLSLLNPKVGFQQVGFTGTSASGAKVYYTVNVNGQTPPTVVSFPATFADLTEVSWQPGYSTLSLIAVAK